MYRSQVESRKFFGLEFGPSLARAKSLASSLDLTKPDIDGRIDAWAKVASTYDSSWDHWTDDQKSRWGRSTEEDVQGLEMVSTCVKHMLK